MPDDRKPASAPLTASASDPVVRAFTEAINAQVEAGITERPITLWWSLSRPDGGGAHVRVTDESGNWIITDVYVHGPRLGATDLQSVPLTQLDLIMNLAGYWEPGVPMDPDVIADVYNEMGQRVLADPDDEPSLAELHGRADSAPAELPVITHDPRPKLTRPDGTDPDGFAARVADAYREYARQTRAPAVKIAEEASVPVATARSWIREARRRGKLRQGRKGKAG